MNTKKLALTNLPYVVLGLVCTNLGEAWRMADGADASEKILSLFGAIPAAFGNPLPSFHALDLCVGLVCGLLLRLAVYLRGKNAKKYRHGYEYGAARWGTAEDIRPYVDPVFKNNIILTQTERLTMNSRPKDPKTARNKNVLIVGGSGSGKTRFFIKPNLMQLHSSYVVTDPKGQLVLETGRLLERAGFEIRVLNTINFKKSMHYNPFAYIHSEKDILKLVTCLITNTTGQGKSGDEFWTNAEKLLYTALIGYIHYEAPPAEQNFASMLEMLNSMEVREDDENFKNRVDYLMEDLERRKPGHFATRQYAKFMAALRRSLQQSSRSRSGNMRCVRDAESRGLLHTTYGNRLSPARSRPKKQTSLAASWLNASSRGVTPTSSVPTRTGGTYITTSFSTLQR